MRRRLLSEVATSAADAGAALLLLLLLLVESCLHCQGLLKLLESCISWLHLQANPNLLEDVAQHAHCSSQQQRRQQAAGLTQRHWHQLELGSRCDVEQLTLLHAE